MSTTVDRLAAPPEISRSRRPYHPSRLFAVLVFLVCGVPSIEGYAQALVPQGNKVIPVFFLGCWALSLFRERRGPRMYLASWLAVGILLLALTSCAVNTTNPIRFTMLSRWVPFLVVTIALIDVMSTKVHPRVAIYGLGAGAVVAGVGALFSFIVLGSPRANGPMEDPNDLAYALTAAIPCLLVGLSRGATGWRLWAGRVGAGICALGALATMSRGGIMAMTAVLAWAILRRLVRGRDIVAGLVVGVLAAGAVVAVAGDAISLALQQKAFIAQGNVDQREMRWEAALRGLSEHPLLGMGPGGASINYVHNSNLAEIHEMTPATHNMYIETAAELGIVAFVLFIALIVTTLVTTTRFYRPDANTALAAQGSMLAIAISSFFLSEEYYMPLWATIAVAAALQIRRTQRWTR